MPVMAMLWGLALAVLTASGLIIYLTMWRPNQTGCAASSGDAGAATTEIVAVAPA